MSILDAFGAEPSNLTVPLTVAAVAGSIGVAAPAGAADSAGVLLDCSVFSFLLQAPSASNAQIASMPAVVVQPVLLFMMSPFLLRISAGVWPAAASVLARAVDSQHM